MKFQMDDTPFHYTGKSGPGILGGTWDIIDVRSVGSRQTYMLWNIYACFSDTFGKFSELLSHTSRKICATFLY